MSSESGLYGPGNPGPISKSAAEEPKNLKESVERLEQAAGVVKPGTVDFIKNYRPIPGGWFHALVLLGTFAVFLEWARRIVVGMFSYGPDGLNLNITWVIGLAVVALILYVATGAYILLVIILRILDAGYVNEPHNDFIPQLTYLKNYWRFNVRGYCRYAACWVSEMKFTSGIFRNGDYLGYPSNSVAIFLPLGGWWFFRRKASVWCSGRKQKVKVHLQEKDSALQENPLFFLTDSGGSRVSMGLESAITFLSRLSVYTQSWYIAETGAFSTELLLALKSKDTLEAENKELKNKISLQRARILERDLLIQATIEKIGESRRFSKSQDGKAIRETLERELEKNWKKDYSPPDESGRINLYMGECGIVSNGKTTLL